MESPTPIRSVAQELSRVPDKQLACRADGHIWPRIRADKKLPKNIKLEPVHSVRICKVLEICDACGKMRWYMTLPEGIFDDSAKREYINPEDWIKIPRSAGVRKADIKAENHRRALEPVISRLFAAKFEGVF